MAPTDRHPPTEDREISVSHLIDAPPELIFRAWTEVRHLSRWLGPDGFTTTTRRFEFRPGGVWEFTMHGPDGTDYPNHVRWQVIEPPLRLVYLHGERGEDPLAFLTTVTLEARSGGTEVTLHSVFPTKERRDEVVEHFGAIEGGRQTLEHLAAYVATLAGGSYDDA